MNDKFKVTFNASYLTGRKHFLENYNYRHGSSEFTLGFDYKFIKKSKGNVNKQSVSDSLSRRVIITYTGGLNVFWNPITVDGEKNTPGFGQSIGFAVNFPLGARSWFQTGFSFERKGYSIKDSSSIFYRFVKGGDAIYYDNTKVQVDYAVIPALIRFPVGKSGLIFINTGPCYLYRMETWDRIIWPGAQGKNL